jgi:hypothetical protein
MERTMSTRIPQTEKLIMTTKHLCREALIKRTISTLAILLSMFLSCNAQSQQPGFTFLPGSSVAVGNRPVDIALGDLNGDGNLDLATANSGSGDVTLLLGDGKSGFKSAPAAPLAVGPTAHLVAVGDVNNDGNLDVAITQHDSYNVTVLLGNGSGAFTPAPGSLFLAGKATNAHNHGLAVADVNGDGNLDLLTSNHGHSSVSVLLGNGKGNFTSAGGSPFSTGRGPYPLALGDVNGDGNLDVVTPNFAGNNVTILLGSGKGDFTPAENSPYPVQSRPYNAAVGDVNGDTKPDIITTHDDVTLITILIGDGTGGFTTAPNSPFDLGYRAYKVTIVDLNRDNKMDLLLCGYPKYVIALLGDGKGGLAHAHGSPFEVGEGPNGIAIEDFNGDNNLDIATANSESNNVTVLLGDDRQTR